MRSDTPNNRTILTGSDPEFISDLSEYLEVLASPVRLHILSFIGSKPRTVRQISHEIETSYENTKKHLARLLSIGLIVKEIGVSDDPANQGQPVFYYQLIPGGLKHAVNNLAIFSSVTGNNLPDLRERAESAKSGLQNILRPGGPGIMITTGPQAESMFELTETVYRIGRSDEGWDGTAPEPAIVLSDEYRSVSRVSKPHAWLKVRGAIWTLSEGNSKGGTYVNGTRISRDPVALRDGDLIDLSPGSLGVQLRFHSGNS